MATGNVVQEKVNQALVREVTRALENLKYGQVVITVHNSKVVQVDKTEKIRFDNPDLYYDRGSGI